MSNLPYLGKKGAVLTILGKRRWTKYLGRWTRPGQNIRTPPRSLNGPLPRMKKEKETPISPYTYMSGARLRREQEILTLLLGQLDPRSPLSTVDAHVLRTIANFRCAAVATTTAGAGAGGETVFFRTEWRDPDDADLLHRGGDLPAMVDEIGNQFWYRDGRLHRGGDEPAVVHASGARFWYKEGELHPAYADGGREWYRDGKRHRDGDLPAIVDADGSSYWYKEGMLHRDGGEPAVVYADGGGRRWYKEGKEYMPPSALN